MRCLRPPYCGVAHHTRLRAYARVAMRAEWTCPSVHGQQAGVPVAA